MSALFLKRFLQSPRQVAYIVPSSQALVEKVAGKLDLSAPRVIVEFGGGEGVLTRELARRMHRDSRLLVFELDPELADHLRQQFVDDARVTIFNANALDFPDELALAGLEACDYVVSGIPFSLLERRSKWQLLRYVYESLADTEHAAFIIYQVTNELRTKGHCRHFARAESEYFLLNIPPVFVSKFYKAEADVRAPRPALVAAQVGQA